MRDLGLLMMTLMTGCIPALVQQPRPANKTVPDSFGSSTDTDTAAQIKWSEFFSDPKLASLIEIALKNNQELNIVALEMDIAKNEVMSRQGEQFPKVRAQMGAGIEKVGKYTSQGVSDEAHGVPEHLPDFGLGIFASWEIDVWSKLRNATKAATLRYLSSVEGRKFAVTVLVGEIANDYYELMALDSQLIVLQQNIALQKEALERVRLQMEAAKVTSLAVVRFEAEVLKNESRQYAIEQRIVATENHLNFLVGRFPQRVERDSQGFEKLVPVAVHAGLPSQLLENRPDVKRAELEMAAAELDVQVAKASFYPALDISVGVGARSFDILRLITTPASLIYNAAADLVAPILNRKALTATYYSANSKQMQAVFNYERAILRGFAEVGTQLATIETLEKSFTLRAKAVEKLNESIEISSVLFSSARADYVEVLLTRREALESQMEMIETKKQQLSAVVNLYQALGGGWR